MDSVEEVLSSGAKLVITKAPFPQALALNKALIRSVKDVISAPGALEKDVSIMNAAFITNAITSDEVEAALFKCFERCTYDNVKVNRELFDDEKLGDRAREDYFSMARKVIEVNCGPFFRQTFSWLKAPSRKPDDAQK